ncbi:MAG: SPOR domain-containing protein [Gammaproteobacteria bacterium]|nr:SPOR domain-containing protein [Gammaproteobacteria bacterium]
MFPKKLYGFEFGRGLIAILLAFVFVEYSVAQEESSYQYVINVESAFGENKTSTLDELKLDEKYAVYSVQVKSRGKTWNRLRLGFFKSRKEANRIIKKIRPNYRGAWIDTVKKYDLKYRKSWLTPKSISKTKKKNITGLLADDEETSAKVLEQARVQMAKDQYDKAIRSYTRLLSRGSLKYRKIAQEYLGVAREKNRQYAHAKAEYKEYLRLYPEGEGADRVRQRLEAIVTAKHLPKRKLSRKRKERKASWDHYGSLYEYYRFERRDSNVLTTDASTLTSSLNMISRRRSDSSDIKMQFSGSYLYDFEEPSEESDARISALFIDMADRPKSMRAKIGRQSKNSSGILGRMDGLWAEYRLNPDWQLNIFGGYPVQTSQTNQIQDHRPFHGISMDFGTFFKYWDFNVFYMTQEVDGILDRDAIGGEIRYVSKDKALFTLLDYDQSYKEINRVFFVGTWFYQNNKSLNVSFNYGKSPYMLTTNALQGQVHTSIADMMTTGGFTETEIREIARDRTADYRSITVSATAPVSKSFAINGDITLSNLSGTPASAGVEAQPSTGDEYYYGVQLIGTSIFTKFDTFIVGAKISDTSSYERNSIFVNDRFNLNKKWRLNPKFILENTTRNNGSETVSLRPALKVDYKYKRDIKFEGELQYEMNDTTGAAFDTSENVYILSAGFLMDF